MAILKLKWTNGIKASWHWDENGKAILDKCDPPELAPYVLENLVPEWIDEVIKDKDNGH